MFGREKPKPIENDQNLSKESFGQSKKKEHSLTHWRNDSESTTQIDKEITFYKEDDCETLQLKNACPI